MKWKFSFWLFARRLTYDTVIIGENFMMNMLGVMLILLVSACVLPFVCSAAEGVDEIRGQLNIASLEVMQTQAAVDRTREEALWQDLIRALNSRVLQGQEAVDQIQKEVLKAWQAAEDQIIKYIQIADSTLGLSRHEQASVELEARGGLMKSKENVEIGLLRNESVAYDKLFEKKRKMHKTLCETNLEYGKSFLLQEKVNKLCEILEGHPELMLSDSTLRLEDGVYDMTGGEFMDLVQCAIDGHLLKRKKIKEMLFDILKNSES